MASTDHAADETLVERILDGDPTAWNAFVDRYSDRVWRRSWQLCSEACPHNRGRGGVFCVFHALANDGVQPRGDNRPSCDEGLEIYAFIFEYFFNRHQETGKLKFFDGRAPLDAFVGAVLHGHLRTDWIRHNRKLRVDQITHPPEIQRLSEHDGLVFEQMVMQRPTETIAREVGLSRDDVVMAQERVTHALMANGNLHLVLRNPEGTFVEPEDTGGTMRSLRILPLRRVAERLWECIGTLIGELPDAQQILLHMAFDEELDAKTMLARVERFGIDLPVTPRTGNRTIHTIYQSIDAVLHTIGERLEAEHADLLREAQHWLGGSDDASVSVTAKGLKGLLKNMGLSPSTPPAPSAHSQTGDQSS